MKNVKNIFNYIQGINPSQSTVSSIGTFVTAQNEQVAEMQVRELISALVNADKKQTLAFKILDSTSRFTEKQIWVIAFELVKIDSFSEMVDSYYAELDRKLIAKANASKAKLNANKEASSDLLASIKNAGKKLGDYYTFIKSNKEYKSEFFSKKYSQKSVSSFLMA